MGVQFKLPRVSYQARWPTVFKNCIKNYRLKILPSVVAKAKTRSIPTLSYVSSKTAPTAPTDHNCPRLPPTAPPSPGPPPRKLPQLPQLTTTAHDCPPLPPPSMLAIFRVGFVDYFFMSRKNSEDIHFFHLRPIQFKFGMCIPLSLRSLMNTFVPGDMDMLFHLPTNFSIPLFTFV